MKQLYKTYGHAKTNLKYHIIFSTRYRRKCLTDIHDQVIMAFEYVEQKSDFNILKMELDKDHIHFLLEFKQSLSIESVVNRLKSISTNQLYKNCYSYLKKFYWNKNELWTRGYFCSTIGEVSQKTIEHYIENQG